MAHIVIDARISGSSTGRYTDKLIQYLHGLNPSHQITILTVAERLEFFNKIAPNFKAIACKYKPGTYGEQYGLVWQLYGLKANLVHFSMIQQPVLYFDKTVTTIHDLITARFTNTAANRLVFGFKQIVYRWVIKRVAKKSTYLITPSEYVKKDVAQYTGISPSKIVVTYEAADLITENPEPLAGLIGKKFIMYVGRSQPHKNLERLVEAFVILKQTHPDLRLVLVGKKDVLYERLANMVNKKTISGVEFTDFVSEGQLKWLYQNCQAYVFPSLSEGFGLPALEAMLHGAPIVSSGATCLPEIYSDGAHYFDPLDVNDMAQKISEILDKPKLRAVLIENGAKQAAKYSWQRMAQQTLDVYGKILD